MSGGEREVRAPSAPARELPDWLPEHPERVNDPVVKRSPADRALIAAIKRATRGRSFEVFRVIAIGRGVLRRFLIYSGRLMPYGKLERRQTELVILRTAAVCRAHYEWIQHVPLARRAGLTAGEIAAIGAGDAVGLQAQDAKLMEAVDELLADHVLSDETFAELRAFLSPALVLEFCLLAGHYAGLAGALNTFGVELEPRMRRVERGDA